MSDLDAVRQYRERAELAVAALEAELDKALEARQLEEDRADSESMARQEAQARVAAVEREATDLLDTIWQTLDPEDAEDVVLEAFPKGAPQWVLNWYHEHPSSAELADEEKET